jgi:short-subunit dehydrogenase
MGKKAIIFGATSGIGKELARLLVADGYQVAITGRREEKLLEIQAENPNQYLVKKHDITKMETNSTVFEELIEIMESIDLIVFSSGIAEPNYLLEW